MLSHPESFWQNVSAEEKWRDYILPRNSKEELDAEGRMEASRLFYFFDSASTVIDYGCGIGRVLQYVAERAGRVVGIDISQNYLNRAREFVKSDNVTFYQPGQYQQENVADFIYCFMVLQHNDETHRAEIMRHIYSLLKIGGTAIIGLPRHESNYYKEGVFIHKFKKEEVALWGAMFRSYRITEGNYPGYEKEYAGDNEYFLIGVK